MLFSIKLRLFRLKCIYCRTWNFICASFATALCFSNRMAVNRRTTFAPHIMATDTHLSKQISKVGVVPEKESEWVHSSRVCCTLTLSQARKMEIWPNEWNGRRAHSPFFPGYPFACLSLCRRYQWDSKVLAAACMRFYFGNSLIRMSVAWCDTCQRNGKSHFAIISFTSVTQPFKMCIICVLKLRSTSTKWHPHVSGLFVESFKMATEEIAFGKHDLCCDREIENCTTHFCNQWSWHSIVFMIHGVLFAVYWKYGIFQLCASQFHFRRRRLVRFNLQSLFGNFVVLLCNRVKIA